MVNTQALKILLIEDDDFWIRLLSDCFHQDPRFELMVTDHLSNALSLIETYTIDLVVCDLILPDSDANNTIETITTKAPYVPIIVVSALQDDLVLQVAHNRGVQDFMLKGEFDLKTFTHVALSAVRRKSAALVQDAQRDLDDVIKKLQAIENRLEQYSLPPSLNGRSEKK